MVYDLLITRSHHDLSWTLEGEVFRFILVNADPIPPIHLTYKGLHAEAGSYLQAKVKRSIDRTTPRIIVDYSTSIDPLDTRGLLDVPLWCVAEVNRYNEDPY